MVQSTMMAQNQRGHQHGNMMNGGNQGQMGGPQMMGLNNQGQHHHQQHHQHQHGNMKGMMMNQGQMTPQSMVMNQGQMAPQSMVMNQGQMAPQSMVMNQGHMTPQSMGGNAINKFGKMPMPKPPMQMKPMGNMMGNMGSMVRSQNPMMNGMNQGQMGGAQMMAMQGSNPFMPNKMGGMMMQQPTGRMNNGISQGRTMMPSSMGNMQQMQGNRMGMGQNPMMGQNTMMGQNNMMMTTPNQMQMGNQQIGGMGQNTMMMAAVPNQMPTQPIVMGQNHMSMAVPNQPQMPNSPLVQQGASVTVGNNTMSFFNAVFPPNSPLGITLEDGHLSYSVNVGNSLTMNRIEVCTIVSSQFQTQILPGDVICSVNEEPTINLPDSAGDVRNTPRSIALGIITQQQQVPRTLKLMRFQDPASVLKNGTVLHFENANDLAPLFAVVGSKGKLNSNNKATGVETISHPIYMAITFPSNQESLGLSLVPTQLTYKLEETGANKTINVCVVTSSSVSQHFRNGDILVKINGLALNSPSGKVATNPMEQNMFLSSVADKLKNADRTNGRTVVVLRQIMGKAGEENGPEIAVADHPEIIPSLILQLDDEEIMYKNDDDMNTMQPSGTPKKDMGFSKSDLQRRTDEEVRKLLAAEDREREARRAVDEQRKLVEEAKQRSLNNLKHSTTTIQRPDEIMKMREKTRKETMEEVIREQAIWV